jgi:uncharacterized protein with HEPN domain
VTRLLSDSNDAARIVEMHGVIADILDLVRDQQAEAFLADRVRPYALAMHFIRLGEEANNISRGTWANYPEIAWRKIANLRHLIAHEYRVIDHAELWRIATTHVPQLADALPTPPPPEDIL